MEETKEKPQVLMEKAGDAERGERARALGGGERRRTGAAGDLRAAQKKLELIQDQPRALIKRVVTQDRSEDATADLKPW